VYDEIKVKAVVNQCKGLISTGGQHVGVPGIFGMNFQAVSVGQKTWAEIDSPLRGGYLDAEGAPNTAVASALDFVDESLGDMVHALKASGAFSKTTIIITAKHGQSPINFKKRRIIPAKALDAAIQTVLAASDYAVTADDAAYIWLKHSAQPKTEDVVKALWASKALNDLPAMPDPNAPPTIPDWPITTWPANPGFEEILWGDTLKLRFNDPLKDSRTPDIIGLPVPGVIWAGAHSAKLAEHGGLAQDDGNVCLLVSNPDLEKKTLKSPVKTTQVAPTILKLLGIKPDLLESVQKEKTDELPLFDS
jgi:arylsulfatase A-like enzyme